MPTPDAILNGLTRIANEAFVLAIAWHAVLALGLLALVLGWRPSRRVAGVLASLPLASAATLALAFGNPFNGVLLGAVSLALAATALGLGNDPVELAPNWLAAIGVGMVVFAWFYPHFLFDRPAIAYMYGAPTGLVPCPTLSLTIGIALIAGGFGSRAWSLLLATAGLFYGVFGAARLGVVIDVALAAGALCLFLVALAQPQTAPSS